MAAALTRLHAGESLTVRSAGTDPGERLSAEAAASVEQVGATFRGEYPKAITEGLLDGVDRIVVIGEAEIDPALLDGDDAPTVERWQTDEPSERGIEGQERLAIIRDDLDTRVRALVQELLV
ncbi:phosphatase [Serinibacter arcticus]|uniref:Phosphatase n=2 Tax=Serinibacter arcticus TaxID=1655435 RepID=A0A2U2A003_9MICO|nr:phosphatase [Serinibacter arcticus]